MYCSGTGILITSSLPMGFLPDSHLGHLASALMSTNKANLAFEINFLVAMVMGMVAMETKDLRFLLNLSPNLFQVYFGVDLALKITLS